MTTTIVTWSNAHGVEFTTRVYNAELASFTADVEDIGGTVLESHTEA